MMSRKILLALTVGAILSSCGSQNTKPSTGLSQDNKRPANALVIPAKVMNFWDNATPEQIEKRRLITKKIRNDKLSAQSIIVMPAKYTQHGFPNEFYDSEISQEGWDIINGTINGEVYVPFQGDVYTGGSPGNEQCYYDDYGYYICDDPGYDPNCYYDDWGNYVCYTPSPDPECLYDEWGNYVCYTPYNSLSAQSLNQQNNEEYFRLAETVWRQPMSTFVQYRRSRYREGPLNWYTDGCSGPLSSIMYDSCTRHDFGYRNWQKYDRFWLSNIRMIDYQFLVDMKAKCRSVYGTSPFIGGGLDTLRANCYSQAYGAYAVLYVAEPFQPGIDYP